MGIARTRTLGGYTNQVGYVYGGPQGSPRDVSYPTTQIGWLRTMHDERNPGFKSRSRRGEVVFSPMSSIMTEYSGSQVSSLWTGRIGSQAWEEGGYRPYSHFPNYPSFPPALVDSLALASAVNRANAGVTPNYALVAVTVAELGKTMRMFRAAGSTARNFANAMVVAARSLRGKKNTLHNQRKAMTDVADSWLQARYGWLPLIYDIQGTVKALNTPFNPRETSRGMNVLKRSGGGQVVGSWRGTYGYSYSWEQETTYRAGIMYENISDLSAAYSSRLGLSVSDALTVPWELVTLSFAVDWFIDIGDWLRAISPKPGMRTLASWTTTKQVLTMKLSAPFVNCTNPGWAGSANGGDFIIRQESYVRSPGASPTIPGYGSGMNLNRSIDAAMLSFQRLKGLIGFAKR